MHAYRWSMATSSLYLANLQSSDGPGIDRFYTENGRFAFLSPPIWGLRGNVR